MFTSTNFTAAEKVALSDVFAKIGTQATPFTSLLLSKGNVEKTTSTIHTWLEKTLDTTEDITFAEGSETDVYQATARKEMNNVLQILKKAAKISGTAQAMGRGDQFSEEINDRLTELKIQLEKILINGVRNDGSDGQPRKMDGLFAFAEHKVTGTGEAVIKQSARALWDSNLDETGELYLFVNADQKEEIDQIYKDAYHYVAKTTSFGCLVSEIATNYGNVNIVVSKHIPEGKMVMFNANYVDLVALREVAFEPLAKNGDNLKGHLVGEYSLRVGTKKAIAEITVG